MHIDTDKLINITIQRQQYSQHYHSLQCASNKTTLMEFNFIESDISHLKVHMTPANSESVPMIYTVFFEEQADLLSEILCFLDVKSLLSVCQTTKTFLSCLRHEHVVTSVLSTSSPFALTPKPTDQVEVLSSIFTLTKEKMQPLFHEDQSGERHYCNNHRRRHAREVTIMKRLLQVFDHYHRIKSSQKSDVFRTKLVNIEQLSPIRLLRLVNGKKCERCNRKLSPSLAGCILPSLTFGKFCCTQCIFT